MTEKVDKKLIEQLKSGEIFEEEPKETDPTKLNQDVLEKGGGGEVEL